MNTIQELRSLLFSYENEPNFLAKKVLMEKILEKLGEVEEIVKSVEHITKRDLFE